MPLYFFDRIENGEVSRGEHGMEFATLEDARFRGAANLLATKTILN